MNNSFPRGLQNIPLNRFDRISTVVLGQAASAPALWALRAGSSCAGGGPLHGLEQHPWPLASVPWMLGATLSSVTIRAVSTRG